MAKFVEQLKFYFKHNWWKFVIIAVVIAIDLVTKIFLVNDETMGIETVLIKNILIIYPVMNSGAGFSLFAGQTIFLIIITFVFLAMLAVFDICYKKSHPLFTVATALIIAGAIGNLIDRIAFGKVRDFIYLKFINFPVFNLADIALTAGVICLAVYIIFYFAKKKKNDTKSQQKAVVETENIEQSETDSIDVEIDDNADFDDVVAPDTNSQNKENNDAKDNS